MENMKKTILLIDDDITVHDVLDEVLSQEYLIIKAYDGKEGVKKFTKNKDEIALVLLDMTMPDMTGLEVLTELNAHGLGGVPVVMLTAMNEYEVESACIEAGAIDYIRKPINVRVMKARLSAHMSVKKNAAALIDKLDAAMAELAALRGEVLKLFP